MNYLTSIEAAKYCRVTRRTIYNWIKRGLKYYKPGKDLLFNQSDLDAFIKQHNSEGFWSRFFNAKKGKHINQAAN